MKSALVGVVGGCNLSKLVRESYCLVDVTEWLGECGGDRVSW